MIFEGENDELTEKRLEQIQVSFSRNQYKSLQKFKGEFGDSDAEVIRSIILIWLTENSFTLDSIKSKIMEND